MEIKSQHRKHGMSSTVRCARVDHLASGDPGIRVMRVCLKRGADCDRQEKGQASGKSPLCRLGFVGQLNAKWDPEKFIAKTFSEGTYLAGQGMEMFSNYTLKDGIRIQVKFYDNRPPGLTDGKAIVATPAERLTPKSVKTVNDGHLVVQAESWSAQ